MEKADARIIPHNNWAVERGHECVMVVSNDTDSVVLLLRYTYYLMNKGLKEVSVQFVVGEKQWLTSTHPV